MILSVTLSKPVNSISEILDKPYEKIKIKIENSSGKASYFAEMFTKTQVFHKHFSEQELNDFIEQHAGTTFKNCVKRTDTQEITILANKKGKITTLTKSLRSQGDGSVGSTGKTRGTVLLVLLGARGTVLLKFYHLKRKIICCKKENLFRSLFY